MLHFSCTSNHSIQCVYRDKRILMRICLYGTAVRHKRGTNPIPRELTRESGNRLVL